MFGVSVNDVKARRRLPLSGSSVGVNTWMLHCPKRVKILIKRSRQFLFVTVVSIEPKPLVLNRTYFHLLWKNVAIAQITPRSIGRQISIDTKGKPKPVKFTPEGARPRPEPTLKTSPKVARKHEIPEPLIHKKKVVPKRKGLVSIIILSYNALEVLQPCVESVIKNTIHPYELIVIDNGSKDGSVEWTINHQGIHVVVENRANIGFSKGNNRGIRIARGEYVLLLNSDTVVITHKWLSKMVKLVKSDPLIGTVGAKLLYQNGRVQHVGGGILGTNPYHPYERHPDRKFRSRRVPYNTGACLLITRRSLTEVGLLDEGYPFGFEDVDYGLRVVEKGLTNIVCTEVVLTHLWAYSQRKTKRYIPVTSLSRYHKKWDRKLPRIASKVKLNWGPTRHG